MSARFGVVVVGGGTAGCVLAARLSESPERSVCLLEAGPDYGPYREGRWPSEILDPRRLVDTHDWGTGGEDQRTLGARIIGGSSSHNACALLQGSPPDYDEWGREWAYAAFAPYLERAKAMLRAQPTNTTRPAPFHQAFISAAQAAGLPLLDDPNDPAQPVGVGPFPANVVDGVRWNAAFAYLDPARERPNVTVCGDTLVDRLLLDGTRATGIQAADGNHIEADTVVLAAGAYFTPAILIRSGIGPEQDVRELGLDAVLPLPVGARLLDHFGTGIGWRLGDRLQFETAAHAQETGGALFEPHAIVKAASAGCASGSWDIHLLSWANAVPDQPGSYEASCAAFHMKPLSEGRLRVVSRDPSTLPHVERGFLSREEDLDVILEALGLLRTIAAAEPLRELLAAEARPGDADLAEYARTTVRNYFHPAGTCAIGDVVDPDGRVLGLDGVVVADASIMPTLPRANTNLTTAAIAERIAETLC